jgi:dTDP-4-dehydrorhamnose reductase
VKILLLGANGQVGWELNRCVGPLGELVTTARASGADLQLDTGDMDSLRAALDSVAPDLVVNATAYTAVDRAESEPERAMLLNAEVPRVIGGWAAECGAAVVHFSTDYVFDGSKDAPYVETDTPNPVSAYGLSKLRGDEALLASGCDAAILRVSWVYGLRGSNFLLTMRRLMNERDELNIVDDQIGAPTWSRSIAQAAALVAYRLLHPNAAEAKPSGVYHLSPGGSTSWFGFASRIRDALGLECHLNPIPTSGYPTPARRPANSRLDSGRLERELGLSLLSWEDDLALCLESART